MCRGIGVWLFFFIEAAGQRQEMTSFHRSLYPAILLAKAEKKEINWLLGVAINNVMLESCVVYCCVDSKNSFFPYNLIFAYLHYFPILYLKLCRQQTVTLHAALPIVTFHTRDSFLADPELQNVLRRRHIEGKEKSIFRKVS